MLVQKEITALTKVDDVELDVPANGKSKAVGKWAWLGGSTTELKADGTAVDAVGNKATWEDNGKTVVVTWTTGSVDTLTLDGNKANVVNNGGQKFTIKRVK